MSNDADLRRGYIYGLGAYFLWGVFPLYWSLLRPASATEVVAHRIVWSLVTMLLLLWKARSFRNLLATARDVRVTGLLTLAACLLGVNWVIFIWAVNVHRVVEVSLGYFINPLFTVVLGVVLFAERLRPAQWVAVAVASLAIAVLTIDYGRLPWIALVLAGTFGIYGLCKKSVGASVGAVDSLAIETAALAGPAMAVLVVMQINGTLTFGHHSAGNTLLLLTTGVITSIPLLLFGAAARRLPLSTLGFLQYLAPVLQFTVGVWIEHEAMPTARWIGFALVWVALAILSVESLMHSRRSPQAEAPQPDPFTAEVIELA